MENSPLTLSSEPQAAASSPVDDFSIGLLLYIVNKSIIWIFLIVIISFSLAIIYLRYTPRTYQATTSIILKQQKNSQVLGVKTPLENHDLTDINREVQLVKSNLFVARVINDLPLQIGYYKEGKTKLISTELYTSSPFVVEVDSILDNAIYNVPIYVKMLDKGKLYLTFSMSGHDNEVPADTGRLISTHYFLIKIHIKNQVVTDGSNGEIYNFKLLDKSSVIDEVADKLEVQPLDPNTKTIGLAYKDGNPNKARDILAVVCD